MAVAYVQPGCLPTESPPRSTQQSPLGCGICPTRLSTHGASTSVHTTIPTWLWHMSNQVVYPRSVHLGPRNNPHLAMTYVQPGCLPTECPPRSTQQSPLGCGICPTRLSTHGASTSVHTTIPTWLWHMSNQVVYPRSVHLGPHNNPHLAMAYVQPGCLPTERPPRSTQQSPLGYGICPTRLSTHGASTSVHTTIPTWLWHMSNQVVYPRSVHLGPHNNPHLAVAYVQPGCLPTERPPRSTQQSPLGCGICPTRLPTRGSGL